MKVVAKSRRIGISWIEAGDSVLNAIAPSGCNTYYCGYNYDMARQFITDCAEWAELFSAIAIAQEEYNPYDGIHAFFDESGALNYRLDLPNGREIVALSSKPENFRSKKGRIVIDECAFHRNVSELLKAANAITIWGGQVRIISTHDGEDNEFNQLVEEVRGGQLPYSLHEIDFKSAVDDGLYQKICQQNNEQWSLEKELAWISYIYDLYGVGASEELDVIPSRAGDGIVFSEAWFHTVDLIDWRLSNRKKSVRFWDLAATEKKLTGKEPCFTSGILMSQVGGIIYVEDAIEAQAGPADIDALIMATAHEDGPDVAIRVELEGGASGIRDVAHLQKLLHQFDFQGVKPKGDKVRRARPLASAWKAGNMRLIKGDWNKGYIKRHTDFPNGPKDTVDASVGAYDYLADTGMSTRDFYVPGEAERKIIAGLARKGSFQRSRAGFGARRFR